MRVLIATLALLGAAACSVDVDSSDGTGAPSAGGYTVEIRADEGEQIYIVSGPDGARVASRSASGTSALLNASDLNRLAAAPAPETGPPGENDVSIQAPGFRLRASGNTGEQGGGHVSMNIGGSQVQVDAHGNGPGEADDHANVRISGLSADDARAFINDADTLSDDVKAQMLAALNL